MTKSTCSVVAKKPRPDFPLFSHACGRWTKMVRGKICYFGKVADDLDSEKALTDSRAFFRRRLEHPKFWRWAVEYGNCVAAVLGVAIHVGDGRAKQPVSLRANLVRRAVVDAG